MKKLLVLLVLFLFIACSKQEEPLSAPIRSSPVPAIPEQPDNIIIEEPVVTPQEQVEPETTAVKEFRVVASQWKFTPNTIEVSQGDRVRIIAHSEDVTHGFVIKEYDISMQLDDNTEKTVEFVADKKGTFSFFCNIPCGSGHGGMRGQLIVR
ncbi:cupredoxin domain-containing protein [Candidatus Woesearchaeota archaeon]|nr:cupredoxin domain-containing protein [Candidatus Woesearchaeota archaeon]